LPEQAGHGSPLPEGLTLCRNASTPQGGPVFVFYVDFSTAILVKAFLSGITNCRK